MNYNKYILTCSTNTATINKTAFQYRTRKPQYSPYYQCIKDNYEEFKRSYERIFELKYVYLRPHIEKVIYQFMDCGILRNGFARVINNAISSKKKLKRLENTIDRGIISRGKYILFIRLLFDIMLPAP